MKVISKDEIAQLRMQMEAYPAAIEALDAIENCEGDLEDASIVLALRAGQEPSMSDDWLAGLAKRYRHLICGQDLRTDLHRGKLDSVLAYLTNDTECPNLLAAPVLIYILQDGIENFCRPLDLGRV